MSGFVIEAVVEFGDRKIRIMFCFICDIEILIDRFVSIFLIGSGDFPCSALLIPASILLADVMVPSFLI